MEIKVALIIRSGVKPQSEQALEGLLHLLAIAKRVCTEQRIEPIGYNHHRHTL